MTKIVIFILFVFLFSLYSVSAEDITNIEDILDIRNLGLKEQKIIDLQKQAVIENLPLIQDYFNKKVKIPYYLESIYKDKIIALHLENTDVIGIKMDEGIIKDIQKGEFPNTQIHVYIKDEVIQKINSNKFSPQESLKKNEITISGLSLMNRIKILTIKLF